MEPPPQGYLFSPFTQVRPESARTQALQPATSTPVSRVSCIVSINNWHLARGTVSDHLLSSHLCRTCTTLTEPTYRQEGEDDEQKEEEEQ